MRRFVVGLVMWPSLGCNSPPVTVIDSAPVVSVTSVGGDATSPSDEAVVGTCFVGVLRRNVPQSYGDTRDYCANGVHYEGALHRLGRLNAFGAPDDAPEGYVRMQATEHDNLWAALRRLGSCPEDGRFPVQARSDWNHEDGGYGTTQEKLRAARYLRASSVESLHLLTVDLPDQPSVAGRKHAAHQPGVNVTLRVSNPLPFALRGLTVVVHYEGGSGKPMPHYEEHPLPTVAAHANAAHDYPLTIELAGNVYRYASLSLEGETNGCTFVPSTLRR